MAVSLTHMRLRRVTREFLAHVKAQLRRHHFTYAALPDAHWLQVTQFVSIDVVDEDDLEIAAQMFADQIRIREMHQVTSATPFIEEPPWCRIADGALAITAYYRWSFDLNRPYWTFTVMGRNWRM